MALPRFRHKAILILGTGANVSWVSRLGVGISSGWQMMVLSVILPPQQRLQPRQLGGQRGLVVTIAQVFLTSPHAAVAGATAAFAAAPPQHAAAAAVGRAAAQHAMEGSAAAGAAFVGGVAVAGGGRGEEERGRRK